MSTGNYFVMYCPEYEINIFLWTVLINLYSNHFKCLPPNVKLGQEYNAYSVMERKLLLSSKFSCVFAETQFMEDKI